MAGPIPVRQPWSASLADDCRSKRRRFRYGLVWSKNEAERNDIQTYEGNAHSLRIVASLEMYPTTSSLQENTYKKMATLRLNTWLFLGVLMADFS